MHRRIVINTPTAKFALQVAELRRELLHRRALSESKQTLADSHFFVDVLELAPQFVHEHIQVDPGMHGVGGMKSAVLHAILPPPS